MRESKIAHYAEERVSDAVKHGKAFTESVTDNLIKRAISLTENDKSSLEKLVDALNGIIDDGEYKYVLNPLNAEDSRHTRFPAKLRNYNIITPIWNRYLGEMIKTRKPIKVGVNNPDSLTRFQKGLTERTAKLLRDKFARSMNASMGTAIPTQEQEVDLGTVVDDYTDNWKDQRAIFGQEAIDKLEKEQDLEYKFWEAYLDWLALGQFYTYKDVVADDVHEEIISPLEYYPIGSADFVEDDNAGVRIFRLHLNDIPVMFRDKLSNAEIKKIEELIINANHSESIGIPATMNMRADEIMDNTNTPMNVNDFGDASHTCEIAHVVFKGLFPIKILSYVGTLGTIQTKEVDAEYVLDKANGDVSAEKVWINRVYESYRIGPEGNAVYVPVSQILVQRSHLNNSSKVKLPYGGKRFLFTNVFNHSIVKALLPYQAIFNIIHRYREMAIAKNKGKMLLMPKGLLANDNEISFEDSIYQMKADGTIYVDETEDNFQAAVQGIRAVDLSDASYIVSLGGILAEIKEEAWDEIGMNRQRFGQSFASDGKGANEEAIFRASIGSLPVNEVFNKAMEKEYEALLDFSKMAWIEEDGTKNKGAYVNSENRIAYFRVNGREHLETNYGVFISNSFQEQKKTDMYEQLVFAIGQQGNMEVASQGIEAGNNAKLRKIIRDWRKAEDVKLQAEQKAQQQQAEAAQETVRMAQAREDEKFNAALDNDVLLQQMQDDNDIAIKQMELDGKSATDNVSQAIASGNNATSKDNIRVQTATARFIASRQPKTSSK